jgi:hypothetical protein
VTWLQFLLYATMFQVIKSGDPKADEVVLSNMTALLDRIFLDVKVCLNSIC